MIDLKSLIADTTAYKTFLSDKRNSSLSHAYLILSQDGKYLTEYLKEFASLIACEKDGCKECRTCKLIEQGIHPDIINYPADGGETVKTEDISDLIEQSYIKPIESDKKIFIIPFADTMTTVAQNKLLKTLEEPPKSVIILLGATSEYPILSTVKSRVKKVVLPAIDGDKLFNALKEDLTDGERLKQAIACGDGTVGKAESLYGDEKLSATVDYAVSVLTEMKSSKEVLAYSEKFAGLKIDATEFLSVLELIVRDLLAINSGSPELVQNKKQSERLKTASGYNTGAIIFIAEKITQARKRIKFNGSDSMVVEWLLFSILEGKHKWQKL